MLPALRAVAGWAYGGSPFPVRWMPKGPKGRDPPNPLIAPHRIRRCARPRSPPPVLFEAGIKPFFEYQITGWHHSFLTLNLFFLKLPDCVSEISKSLTALPPPSLAIHPPPPSCHPAGTGRRPPQERACGSLQAAGRGQGAPRAPPDGGGPQTEAPRGPRPHLAERSASSTKARHSGL